MLLHFPQCPACSHQRTICPQMPPKLPQRHSFNKLRKVTMDTVGIPQGLMSTREVSTGSTPGPHGSHNSYKAIRQQKSEPTSWGDHLLSCWAW
jgi:hypothetical protein